MGILAVGALLTGLMIKFRRPPEVTPPEVSLPLVRVAPLAPTNHQFVVRSQGTVAPRTEIDLVAEVAGRVLRVAPSFRTGGFFEAGELLVQIDPTDYELAVTRARATLAQARTALDREEAEARVAREEWERWGQGEPSPLLLREPQLAQARAAVESAKAGLSIAERDLERCRITAPFAGRVRAQRADVGQFVNRGQVVGRIYAVDYAEVRLPLPLEDLAYVELPVAYEREETPDQGPAVTLSARLGGRTWEWQGRIVRTEGEIDARTRMLHAVARVDHPYGRSGERPPLAVGLFVQAAIE
ncbi:MAG: efflux RND transporter periplasmic adaptor subunit, partial [Verrucomicrobia bacterium]